MGKLHLCSYGNQIYYESLNLLEKTAYEIGGIDKFHRYTRDWIEKQEFYQKNKYIFDKPRGNGYWLYKMYALLDVMNNVEEGDIVIYSDAGIKVIENLTPLKIIAQTSPNSGIMPFRLPGGHINKTWCKRDTFILMDCDNEKYWNSEMCNGAISVWVKNEISINFIKEWLKYCKDPRILTDDPNMCGLANHIEFKDHRHDQSVLSLIAIKHNLEVFRDPTQWGNDDIDKFPNSPYKQLFYHHRNFKQ